MKKLLARRERYGWSWPELSRRCGLPVWKLHYWRRRLSGKKKPSRKSCESFVRVQVVKPARVRPQNVPPLELLTPSGLRIVVEPGFDADHLRRVVRALESGC
jgi:hypothetical protein